VWWLQPGISHVKDWPGGLRGLKPYWVMVVLRDAEDAAAMAGVS
jgi:hypothetical protein